MDASLNLVMDGARLGAVGMVTVFVFLTVLVMATSAMSRFVARFAPPAAPEAAGAADDGRLAAVVAAAIHAHRKRQ